MSGDTLAITLGFIEGLLSSTVFVLVVMIGFCVLIGVAKLKRTAGGGLVVRSLDEQVDRKPAEYLSPGAPRGPADQLRSPELLARP